MRSDSSQLVHFSFLIRVNRIHPQQKFWGLVLQSLDEALDSR
jgi:hypothetical protein